MAKAWLLDSECVENLDSHIAITNTGLSLTVVMGAQDSTQNSKFTWTFLTNGHKVGSNSNT